ncbi:ParB N-terminal domain-containing protein [Pseudoxanthomonas winnipegensis]|uniref:ParB-like N-terminal domain-containing protein n=1 Tax=Pseudoxanthomonas winnipegensis TaxID=2480810 RepID=A0A4Q8L9U7_9GAMM|nr:ParB N-terminal domain-containing protein [Pseudoxanthomonas winnipegensis]TAA25418.1 hypothetical protein EA660_08130 [Pseudoxanthomonas winnipegensis]
MPQQSRELHSIALAEVQLSKSRPTVPETVNALSASMAAAGLLNPIIVRRAQVFVGIVRDGYKVVAGNHRVSAARALGWTHIDAFIHDGDELTAELAEIDENLQRAELTPAQRAAAIHRRKEIWEAMHPINDRNPVENRARGRPVDFAGDTQKATGEDRRRTNEHLSRAEALGPDIHEVVGTSLDKGVELDALKELPAEERRELIDRAKAGEKVSARPAKGEGKPAAPKKPAPAAGPADSPPAAGGTEGEEGGDYDLHEVLAELQEENRQLQDQVKAAAADDQVAETLKWQSLYENAVREQSRAQDAANESQKREQRVVDQLRRCARAVGVEDPRKVAAKVETLAKAAKEAGVWPR